MKQRDINALKLYLQSLPRLADQGERQRVAHARRDFWYFIRTYFAHHVEHAQTETSIFRRFVHERLYDLSQQHHKLLFTAYRGAAKTTAISQLFMLWLLAKQDFRFGVLISASDTLAGLLFEFYKTELEENANFRHDFNITLPGLWREKELLIDVNGHLCKLAGYGAGKKLRGVKFLSYRPDVIIVDDIEDDEQVMSKAQRDKLYAWFVKVVLRLPARTGHYRVIVVGTVLHQDSLLKRLESRRDFVCHHFPLVLRFPNEADTPGALDGLALDDSRIDGAEVMADYHEDKDSFLSEYQNQPLSDDSRLVDHYQTFEKMPNCEAYFMGLDPAMGKQKGDYFGLAVIGKQGEKFYATVKGYRMSPVRLIGRIIATYARYAKIAPTTLAIEIVQFQEFFKDVLKKEAAALGVPLAVKALKNTAPKALRIDSIAPLIADETILVHQADHLLIEELESYPLAAHDDLLDALEMAYRIFRARSRLNYKAVREKLKKRNFGQFRRRYA